jgi:hypothetical protein
MLVILHAKTSTTAIYFWLLAPCSLYC